MQKVSQKWKDNQNELLTSESFVEVSLKITDPDASKEASPEDNGAIYISNSQQTVNKVDKVIVPYATLERNMWVLNGSRKIIPTSNYGDCGYISESMCDSNGLFTTIPIFTIRFSQVHNNLIPGVTILWGTAYNEYATEFIVTAYEGNTIVATKKITGNEDIQSVVSFDIVGYDRITISILEWSMPYRRARIDEFLAGGVKMFSKSDLFSYSHSQEVDPVSASLPKTEISFSLDNSENTYNPHNLDSLAKYLIERQEVKSRYGYKIGDDIEWIDCGTFYMSEWNASQGSLTADFTARDLLEFMTDTYYYGVYSPDGVSLYDLALSVLQDANLPLEEDGSVKWVIDESLKNISTTAPLPVDTHANCLQLIANAGCCVLYQDRKGVLRIEPFTQEKTDYEINHFNSHSRSEINLSKPLRQVEVSSYSYRVVDAEESTEIYRGSIGISGTEDITIQYSGTFADVTAYVTNGTLNSATFYANVCVLNITAEGTVKIVVEGYTLESSSSRTVIRSGESGETISVDNPLITSASIASKIGKWVESYMKNRMILSSDWRADPRLDALDIITNTNDYNTNEVLITNVKYSYNGAFKGSCEGRVI